MLYDSYTNLFVSDWAKLSEDASQWQIQVKFGFLSETVSVAFDVVADDIVNEEVQELKDDYEWANIFDPEGRRSTS